MPIPLAFAGGAVVAHVWFARAPRAFAKDLAQPLPIVTAWGAYGSAGFAILGVTLVVATLALIVAARRRRAGTAAVVAVAAASLAANFAWPALFSSDVYAYAAYGDLANRGFDPYVLAPARLHDAFLDTARWQWTGAFPPCVYGPVFVAFARAVVALGAPFGVAATLALLRLCACAAFLGSIALLGLALRDETREHRTLALYAYGLNPMALWSVAEGHNDALLLLGAAAAFALARRRDAPLGVFTMALGPLVKAPGIVLAATCALDLGWIRRERPAAIGLALGAGTAVAASLALPPVLPALGQLGRHGVYAPTVSVQGLIGPVWAALAATAAFGYAARLVWARERRGFAWAAIALTIALPNAYPWYVLWLVPPALAAGPSPAAAALWGATIFAALRYLPDAAGNMTAEAARVASAVTALPLALALLEFRPSARRKTTTPP